MVDRGRKIIGRASFFEGAVTVGDTEPGDIMNRLILQIAPRAGVEDRVSERHVFRPVEPLEDFVREIDSDAVAGIAAALDGRPQKIAANPDPVP